MLIRLDIEALPLLLRGQTEGLTSLVVYYSIMPQPTKIFIEKVEANQRRLNRLRYVSGPTSYRKTKVCHSLIHNLVEAYDKYGNTKAGQSLIRSIRSDIYEYI